MINVSSSVKTDCNSDNLKYKEYILVGGQTVEIRGKMSNSCYNEGNIFGTFIMKKLEFTTENNIDYKGKEVVYYKSVNGESFKIGTYIVTEIKDNDSDETVTVTSLDYGLKTAIPYTTELDYTSGTVTLFDVLIEACTNAGLNLANGSITNGDFIVDSNQFIDNQLIGDVIKAIAHINGDFATVNENDEVELVYEEETDEIIEDYTELADKRDTHPITSVSIGTSQVSGQEAILRDEDMIAEYGEHWLVLNDNPFAYTLEKRQELVTAVFNKVKGFSYSSFESSYSFKPYLQLGDKIQFRNKAGELINSRVLKIDTDYDDIKLSAPSIINATVDYENSPNSMEVAKRAEVIANQATASITLLASSIETTTEELTNATTLIAETEEGKNFHLEDSAEANNKTVELYGESTQPTRSGKNLILNTKTTTTINGITFTVNADKTITVNGTATANTYIRLNLGSVPNTPILAGTYTLSGCPTGGSAETYYLAVELSDTYGGTKNQWINCFGNSTTQNIVNNKYFETIISIKKDITISNLVFKPQLEEGTTATPYEQYGVQPSPDYPSDIDSVESPISITSTGENNTSTVSIPLLHPMRSLPNGTRDRIYYDNGKWYDEQNIGIVTLNGSESWSAISSLTNTVMSMTTISDMKNIGDVVGLNCIVDRFGMANIYNIDIEGAEQIFNRIHIRINKTRLATATLESFKTWLDTNNITLQYELATPIVTEITSEATITALENIKTYKGITNIISDAPSKLIYYRDTSFAEEYEPIIEANKKQRVTTEKFAQQEIKNDSIVNSVSTINTTIINDYATKSSVTSEIAQTVDEITATVQKVGGNNLIKNSAMKNGSNFWLAHLLAPYIESDTPPTEDLYDGAYWYCSSNYENYHLGIIYRYESGNWIETTLTRKYIDDNQNLLEYTTQYENDYTRQNTLSNSIIKLDGGTNLDISHIFTCANPIDIIKGQEYITLSFKLKNSMITGVGYIALGFTEKYIDNAMAEMVYSLYEPCVWFTPDDVKDLTEIVLTVKVPQKRDFMEATASLTAPTTDKLWIDLNTYQLKEYNEETELWERKQTILPCYETTTRQIWAYRQLFDIYYETPVNFDNFEIKCVYPAFTMYPEFMRLIPSDVAPTPFKGAYWLNVSENAYRAKYNGDEFVEWEDTGISTEYIMTHPFPPQLPTQYGVPIQGYYEIADIKAEWNKVATEWSGYPGEIYGKNVKIDEKGMKIISGQNTMFIDEDEIIAKFNDEAIFIISKDLVQFRKMLLLQQVQIGSYVLESRNITNEEHLLLY
jgi:hypothetical protein